MSQQFLTLQSTAEYLGVSTKTVHRLIVAGRLTAYVINPKVVRIREADVLALLDSVRTGGTK